MEHEYDRTYPEESVGAENRTIKRVNNLHSSDGQKHSSKPTLTCFCLLNQEQLLHGSCQIDQTPLTETVIVSLLNTLHSNLKNKTKLRKNIFVCLPTISTISNAGLVTFVDHVSVDFYDVKMMGFVHGVRWSWWEWRVGCFLVKQTANWLLHEKLCLCKICTFSGRSLMVKVSHEDYDTALCRCVTTVGCADLLDPFQTLLYLLRQT